MIFFAAYFIVGVSLSCYWIYHAERAQRGTRRPLTLFELGASILISTLGWPITVGVDVTRLIQKKR
jgi:hypothetical protein